jgi:hypothetical protein
MYLRFVTLNKDRDSKQKQGLITTAYDLRDEGELDRYELESVNRIINWFKANLTIPPILKREDSNRCIAWFKSDAKEPLDLMWELYHLLQSKGIPVEVLKQNEIGDIRYEDEWQVIAQPLRHNRKIKK